MGFLWHITDALERVVRSSQVKECLYGLRFRLHGLSSRPVS